MNGGYQPIIMEPGYRRLSKSDKCRPGDEFLPQFGFGWLEVKTSHVDGVPSLDSCLHITPVRRYITAELSNNLTRLAYRLKKWRGGKTKGARVALEGLVIEFDQDPRLAEVYTLDQVNKEKARWNLPPIEVPEKPIFVGGGGVGGSDSVDVVIESIMGEKVAVLKEDLENMEIERNAYRDAVEKLKDERNSYRDAVEKLKAECDALRREAEIEKAMRNEAMDVVLEAVGNTPKKGLNAVVFMAGAYARLMRVRGAMSKPQSENDDAE